MNGYQLWDEIVTAIHEHKRTLLAWAMRRATQTWPIEKRVRRRSVANELETEAGMTFPESEIEAYCLVVAKISAELSAELGAHEAEHGPVKRIEPPAGLSDADALAAIDDLVWDGHSLVKIIEEGKAWNDLVRNMTSREKFSVPENKLFRGVTDRQRNVASHDQD